MIRFESVSKSYCDDIDRARARGMIDIFRRSAPTALRPGEYLAVRDLSFEVGPGETCLILGVPGAGKSTIAKLACGVTLPTSGRVVREGRAVQVQGSKIGATPLMTLDQYVRLLCMLLGSTRNAAGKLTRTLLGLFPFSAYAARRCHDCPDDLLKRLTLIVSLSVEADIYVFNGTFRPEWGDVHQGLGAEIRERLARKTKIVLAATTDSLPREIHQSMILHAGTVLQKARSGALAPLFNSLRPTLECLAGGTDAGQRRELGELPEVLVKSTEALEGSPDGTALIRRCTESLVEDQIQRLARSGTTLLVGPYISDVGFELLYWIPFLRWAIQAHGIGKERLVALSRCGADSWYRGLCGRYLDVHDLMEAGEFASLQAARIGQTGSIKQSAISDLDRVLAEKAKQSQNDDSMEVLHPSLMYRLLNPVWRRKEPSSYALRWLIHERLSAPAGPGAEAPEVAAAGYATLRVDFSACFLDREEDRAFARTLAGSLQDLLPVVDLNTLIPVDSHRDFDLAAGLEGRMRQVRHLATPRNNLDLLTRLVSGSRVCVGTHSGLGYLPLMLGKSYVNFYTTAEAGTFPVHLELMERLQALPALRVDGARVRGPGAAAPRELAAEAAALAALSDGREAERFSVRGTSP